MSSISDLSGQFEIMEGRADRKEWQDRSFIPGMKMSHISSFEVRFRNLVVRGAFLLREKTGVSFSAKSCDMVLSFSRALEGQHCFIAKGKMSKKAPLTPVVLVLGRNISMLLSL